VIDAGIRGLGVYGRSPLTPDVRENLPSLLLQGVIIAADRRGSRMLLAAFQPRRQAAGAAAELAPDVTLEPVGDYLMVSCSVAPGTVIPPAGGWTGETPALLREPEPGRVLTESDTGSSSVTTFTVSPQGGASLVQISTTWDGAHGIGGYFERMFAPRVMRAIYLDELSRLAAYAREHRSA
jgi:hypothetical protein